MGELRACLRGLNLANSGNMADEGNKRQELAAQLQWCDECGRPWEDERERWRALRTIDGGVSIFCPECAEREFGSE